MKNICIVGVLFFLSSVCNGNDALAGAGAGVARAEVPEYILSAPEEMHEALLTMHNEFMGERNDFFAQLSTGPEERLGAMESLIGVNEAFFLKQCQLLAFYCAGGIDSAGIWTIRIRKYLQAKALEYETIADFFVETELSSEGRFTLDTIFVFELGMKWVSVGARCIMLLEKEYDSLQGRLHPVGRAEHRVVLLGINGDENIDLTEKWEKESQEIQANIKALIEWCRLELRFAWIGRCLTAETAASAETHS